MKKNDVFFQKLTAALDAIIAAMNECDEFPSGEGICIGTRKHSEDKDALVWAFSFITGTEQKLFDIQRYEGEDWQIKVAGDEDDSR